MNAPINATPVAAKKLKVATTSLAGCFGCHMSFLDIDERILKLLELVEFDRSPLTDIKHCGPCDLGLIEGGLCNAENVHVLREFRKNCKILVAVGACAINGGLPAQRNHLDLRDILEEVYQTEYLLGRAGKAGIQLDVSPKTGTHVSSGWRPAVINEHTAGAAPNSKHITGQAVDIYDPEGALDEWCLDHADTDLAIVGLWLEHPAATKGWCHVQTVPPASKRRVFYP